MGRYTILFKPTHKCNLNCDYCYDRPNREQVGDIIMPLETLEEVVKRIKPGDEVEWIWHGGECSVIPVEYFYEARKIFDKYFDRIIHQNMQSNGYEVSDEFLKMCKECNIRIGFSYDFVTQSNRSGSDTDRVRDTIKRARAMDLQTGCITVIHNENIHMMKEYYLDSKTIDIGVSFNHVFSTPNADANNITLDTRLFKHYFKDFFKFNIFDDSLDATLERSNRASISSVLGARHFLCAYTDCRHNFLCVDASGRVLPCDRTYPDKYIYPNVLKLDWVSDYFNTHQYNAWVFDDEIRIRTHCYRCEYYKCCMGGCPSTHIGDNVGDTTKVSSSFCSVRKDMLDSAYEVLKDLDPYNSFLNKDLSFQLLHNNIYLPIEIREACKILGIDLEENEDVHWTHTKLVKLMQSINRGKSIIEEENTVFSICDWSKVRNKRIMELVDILEDRNTNDL